MARQMVKEYIANELEVYAPSNPVEFMEYFQNLIDLIPKKYMKTARIELEVKQDYYDSTSVGLDISYSRPETLGEQKNREAKNDLIRMERNSAELIELERLQKKYGVPMMPQDNDAHITWNEQ